MIQWLESRIKKIEEVPGKWGKQNWQNSTKDKKIQSELLKNFEYDQHRWLLCSTDPRKAATIFHLSRANGRSKGMEKDARYDRLRSV